MDKAKDAIACKKGNAETGIAELAHDDITWIIFFSSYYYGPRGLLAAGIRRAAVMSFSASLALRGG